VRRTANDALSARVRQGESGFPQGLRPIFRLCLRRAWSRTLQSISSRISNLRGGTPGP